MEEKKEKKQVSLAVIIILAVVIAFALGYACKMIIDNRTNTLPKVEEKDNDEIQFFIGAYRKNDGTIEVKRFEVDEGDDPITTSLRLLISGDYTELLNRYECETNECNVDEGDNGIYTIRDNGKLVIWNLNKESEEKIPELIGSKTLTSKEFNEIEEYTNKEYIISDLNCKITILEKKQYGANFNVKFNDSKEYNIFAWRLTLNMFNNYYLINQLYTSDDEFVMHFYDNGSFEEKYTFESFDSKIKNDKLELLGDNRVSVSFVSIKNNEVVFEGEYGVTDIDGNNNLSSNGNEVKDVTKYCNKGDIVLINYSLTEKDGVFSITEKEHKCGA